MSYERHVLHFSLLNVFPITIKGQHTLLLAPGLSALFLWQSGFFEIEKECCALAWFADDGNIATVATNKFLADYQSQPRPFFVGQTGCGYRMVGVEKFFLVFW